MIYILNCIEGKFIKVGRTRSLGTLDARITAMQTGCPYTLQVVETFLAGTLELEHDFHTEHAHRVVRGEWYLKNPDNGYTRSYPWAWASRWLTPRCRRLEELASIRSALLTSEEPQPR